MASKFNDCDFSREPSGYWCCEGNGNLLGERSFGHGKTRAAAYEDYQRVVRVEMAGMIDDDAEEAELVQSEIRGEGADPDNYGTSLRDGLMAIADTEAMRDKARQLRGENLDETDPIEIEAVKVAREPGDRRGWGTVEV